jgi:pyruvate ferredoxin oxidoreductase alpha subunit
LVSFIGGLGGRDIEQEEFFEMAQITQQAADDGHPPPPRLLYTSSELREIKKMQTIALHQGGEKCI